MTTDADRMQLAILETVPELSYVAKWLETGVVTPEGALRAVCALNKDLESKLTRIFTTVQSEPIIPGMERVTGRKVDSVVAMTMAYTDLHSHPLPGPLPPGEFGTDRLYIWKMLPKDSDWMTPVDRVTQCDAPYLHLWCERRMNHYGHHETLQMDEFNLILHSWNSDERPLVGSTRCQHIDADANQCIRQSHFTGDHVRESTIQPGTLIYWSRKDKE